MLRFLSGIYFVCFLAMGTLPMVHADEIHLTNGDILKGQPADYREEGLVVKLDIGEFSQRVHWIKVTQESLKQLAQNPKIAPYAEPFIELPMETNPAKKKSKEIRIKPVPRVERVMEKSSLLAAMTTTSGLVMLGFLFLGNLFAAYEIAVYRRRPVALVCGVSAVLPVVGPILFLATPAAKTVLMESTDEGMSAASNELVNPMAGAGAKASGLSVASHDKGGGGGDTSTKVFKKGDTTFNRRWFEVTFTGFFRVVPSEAEKNLVLVVKAGRNEYVAKRITRISMTDIHLQLINAGEVSVSFDEIHEVQVRHKDAKA